MSCCRFLAFDFVMPNHQIVEVRGLRQHLLEANSPMCLAPQCYIVFSEMEHTKKAEDPMATVCPELSNHEIFEKVSRSSFFTLLTARL